MTRVGSGRVTWPRVALSLLIGFGQQTALRGHEIPACTDQGVIGDAGDLTALDRRQIASAVPLRGRLDPSAPRCVPRASPDPPPRDEGIDARPDLRAWFLPHASPLARDRLVPITRSGRVSWVVDGSVGAWSLGIGLVASSLQTGLDIPSEWHRTRSGFADRYLEREVDVAMSSTIEAGVGALWGEDPRYLRSGRTGVWPRVGYAIETAVLAPRRDGRTAPAWGRYAGNVVNNVIENAWLPPSATTPGQTTLRSVEGIVGRVGGNLWQEFWPDVEKRLRR